MSDERMPAASATCEELIGFLHDYLDGELAEERRHVFEAHLAECPSCLAYLATYRETVRLARAVEAPADEAVELPDELVEVILASR